MRVVRFRPRQPRISLAPSTERFSVIPSAEKLATNACFTTPRISLPSVSQTRRIHPTIKSQNLSLDTEEFQAPLKHSYPPAQTRVFSGIQPTGAIHLGNYLGAIANWVELQSLEQGTAPAEVKEKFPIRFDKDSTNSLIFCIVDLHSLTTENGRSNLDEKIHQMAATLLGCGLHPDNCVMFNQSKVGAHAELSWILSCLTPMFRLSTMIQYKEKSTKERDASLGILAYPVLMAADMLLYRATHVPVGDDQTQHLQLTNAIVDKFNRVYQTNLFIRPNPLMTSTSRISNLKNAQKKMSKSDTNDNTRINLTDTADQISYKIKKAVTDSIHGITYDPVNRPEVANLLHIFSALTHRTPESISKEFVNSDMGKFKSALSDVVVAKIDPISQSINKYMNDRAEIERLLTGGAEVATHIALENLKEAKKLMGLI